jgi:Dolichyl-phosphate-mannose-protein mannosyltransferase
LPLRLSTLGFVAAAALLNGMVLAPGPLVARLLAELILFVVLPGYLFVALAFRGSRPAALEQCLLALGCGYALAILLTLLLHALFRPLLTAHIVVGANALNFGLLLAAVMRRAELRPRLGRPSWPLLTLLAVAAPFRLANLGHSEFQGDEAEVVLRTLALLQGVPDALISHRKPPGEVLIHGLFVGGLGLITEAEARLPFALAGIGAVAAVYLLGRAMFGTGAGLAAGLLLAVNGYFVAFARILQYQSVVLLLDTLAVLCLFRLGSRPTAPLGYAVVGGLLLAGSALSALSAILLLPVAALALWPRLVSRTKPSLRLLGVLLWPLLLAVPVCAAVYGFLLHDSGDSLDVASTWLYLGPRVGTSQPYFNLERFLLSANHYTSSLYLVVVLGVGTLVLLAALYESCREATKWRAAPVLSFGLVFAALAIDTRNLSLALLVATVIYFLITTARRSLAWKLALAWLAAPLFVHLFLIRNPGTHWREVFPGLLLLVAAAVVGLYARLGKGGARLAALVAGGVFLAATGHYVYTAWIQPSPEYQSLYPLYRHPLDWSNQNTPAAEGVYGAAHRHGWKTVGQLMTHGQIGSQYDTNESEAVSAWYLKRPRACGEAVRLFVEAPRTLRYHQAIEQREALPGYAITGWVYVDDRPKLALLERPAASRNPIAYRMDDYGWQFDRELASPWAPVGRLYRGKEISPDCPRSR